MNLKEEVLIMLEGAKNIKRVKYYKESPHMKNRYKPEYIEQEVWVYTPTCPSGYVITESDFKNKEYMKNYIDMIKAEI